MEFKDSRTYQNLVNAFAGESQARNRYSFYSEVAEKEGLLHVAAIFTETADNEREHAKVFYDHIVHNLGAVTIHVDSDYPASVGSTWENLEAAAAGEHEEFSLLYKMVQQSPKKKVTTRLPNPSRKSPRWKNSTTCAIKPWLKWSRTGSTSSAITKFIGSAATAAISTRAKKPPRSAQPASTRKSTLRLLVSSTKPIFKYSSYSL